MRQKTVRPPCASVEGSDMKIVPTETACLGVGVRVAAGAKSQIVSEGNSPAAKTTVRFRHAKLLQVRDLEEGGRCRVMVREHDVLSRQEQRDDPGHIIDLSPPNWTGSQSSFLAQRDEDGRVPLLVSPHPHTSVHDVGHGVRGVLIGLQRRSVGVDPYCMTSNHCWSTHSDATAKASLWRPSRRQAENTTASWG